MKKKAPIMPAIRQMEKGEVLTYPMTRMNAVHKTVYEANILLPGKFKTSQSKESGIITVTRIA